MEIVIIMEILVIFMMEAIVQIIIVIIGVDIFIIL
jgi:hypothetical protein